LPFVDVRGHADIPAILRRFDSFGFGSVLGGVTISTQLLKANLI
jgi:hypothetical protein